jgi:hypothetical protein
VLLGIIGGFAFASVALHHIHPVVIHVVGTNGHDCAECRQCSGEPPLGAA